MTELNYNDVMLVSSMINPNIKAPAEVILQVAELSGKIRNVLKTDGPEVEVLKAAATAAEGEEAKKVAFDTLVENVARPRLTLGEQELALVRQMFQGYAGFTLVDEPFIRHLRGVLGLEKLPAIQA